MPIKLSIPINHCAQFSENSRSVLIMNMYSFIGLVQRICNPEKLET